MKSSRRYVLMFFDSTGQGTHRLSISRAWAVGLVAFAVTLGAAVLWSTVHGFVRWPAAREVDRLRYENSTVERDITELSKRLPGSRLAVERAATTFDQVWARSGLGVEERVLGIGPVSPEAESAEAPPGEPEESKSGGQLAERLGLLSERADGLVHSMDELMEYFHDASHVLSKTPSIRPVRARWLTSAFGRRRDPIDGRWVVHKGMDLGGAMGTQILAPADGIVIWTGSRGGYGQTVVLDHGYGIQTHFAHLSGYRVSPGDTVQRGDVIAEMGNTGRSTGPHLHYEVRRHGQPLNPVHFILD